MANPKQSVQLTLQVERSLFRKPEDGWSILKGRDDTGKSLVAKGKIEWEIRGDERLILTGWWQRSPRNGAEEFCFHDVRIDLPTDPKALLHYAVSITTGLGGAKELQIWDAYQAAWPTTSEGLDLIPGVSQATKERWAETLKVLDTDGTKARTMAWLLAKGATDRLAALAWARWSGKTMAVVEADCYVLTDLAGYGFKRIDEMIRPNFGIEDLDPRRVSSAWLYTLAELTTERGDTVVSYFEALRKLGELGIPAEVAEIIEGGLEDEEQVRRLTAPGGQPLLALAADWAAETAIASWLGRVA